MPTISRKFSRVDAKRSIIMVAILALVGGCYWLMLPGVQSQILPNAPGGGAGPWVVRPILAFHFGAVAVMASVTLPVLTRPLRSRWRRENAALGTRYVPFDTRPVKRLVFISKGILLLLIYASALMFYLFSWTTIEPAGIEQRLPWTTLRHSFGDIESLEVIPVGERSDTIRQDGPWYSIKFQSGRSITWGHDNEGTTHDELNAMATYVADRSGLPWTRRSDARAR